MTNSYGNLNAAVENNYAEYRNHYDEATKTNRAVSSVVKNAGAGFILGTGVAAGIDYFQNRKPVKGDSVSEKFAQKVFKKYTEKGYAAKGKEFFKQKEIVKSKLGKIKTISEFKTLMKGNKKFCETLCDGISLDNMCEMVNKDNLKDKISALQKRIKSAIEPEMQNIKDSIKLCWNSEEKKFVKPNEVSDKLFKIIKNTPRDIEWGKAMKYGGITAGVLGSLALISGILGAKLVKKSPQAEE